MSTPILCNNEEINTTKERVDTLARRVDIETKTEELVLPIIEANNFELVDVEYVKEGGKLVSKSLCR